MIITEIQYFFSKIIRFQAIFKDTVEFTCALEFKISSQLFFQKVIRLLLFYGVRPVFQQVIQVYFVLFAAKLAVDLGNGVFIAQFLHLFLPRLRMVRSTRSRLQSQQ